MPTTDIPPPGRAAGTASRCGPLPRALRLLREKQRREAPRSQSVRESRAGASELRRWSRPPAPRCACRAASARPAASSPLRFAAPNRQLLRSAPARSAPGGASLRSAAAQRPRPRPLPSALGNGSLRSGGFEKELGNRGRQRSHGEGRGGRSRDARRGQAVSGQPRGVGGGRRRPEDAALGSSALSTAARLASASQSSAPPACPPASSRGSQEPRPDRSPAGLVAPRGPCAPRPRHLQQPLCEVEPIVRCPGHACLLATPLRPTQCHRPENLSYRP